MISFTDNVVLSINDTHTSSTDVFYFDFSNFLIPLITECICGYRNGTTKIANDGVIRSAGKGNIP